MMSGFSSKYFFPVAKASPTSCRSLCFSGSEPRTKGTPEISLPLRKDWPEIQEKNVVFLQSQIRRVLVIRQQGISTGANNSFVPIGRDAIHLFGQSIDIVIQLALGDASADQALGLYFIEKTLCLSLSLV